MAVLAIIEQLQGSVYGPVEGGASSLPFGVYYTVVDTTLGKYEERNVQEISLSLSSPGNWKDALVQGIIDDAALGGYTLLPANLYFLALEQGDYKYVNMVAAWTANITKTNIGVTYVNAYAGNNGLAQLVDFGGFKQYRFVVQVNKVGTGTQDAALVDIDNASNLIELSDAAAAGEHSLDSGWTNKPSWMVGEKIIKPMVRSSVAADDPVYRQFVLYLR
jgi:hypothetical protein